MLGTDQVPIALVTCLNIAPSAAVRSEEGAVTVSAWQEQQMSHFPITWILSYLKLTASETSSEISVTVTLINSNTMADGLQINKFGMLQRLILYIRVVYSYKLLED